VSNMEEKKKSCQVPGFSGESEFKKTLTKSIENTSFL